MMAPCLSSKICSSFLSLLGKTVAGAWSSQYRDLSAGVLGHPVCIFPGSPENSLYPANFAEQTSLLFFMFPSRTRTDPHPGLSHLCATANSTHKVHG